MAGERRNLYFMGIGSNAFSVGFALWSRSRQCMAQWLGCQGCGSHGWFWLVWEGFDMTCIWHMTYDIWSLCDVYMLTCEFVWFLIEFYILCELMCYLLWFVCKASTNTECAHVHMDIRYTIYDIRYTIVMCTFGISKTKNYLRLRFKDYSRFKIKGYLRPRVIKTKGCLRLRII